jgi:uncharacterized membrane protein
MPRPSEAGDTARIEAFSDGVFAIAMTLLVLAIRVPRPSELGARGLGSALLGLWPHYLAFVTSFATILAMWVNHHRIFTFVRTSDHFLLYWNGLLLLLITFLPFPTALLAEYLMHAEEKVAGASFAGNLLAIALVFQGMWSYVARSGGLLAEGFTRADVAQITRQHRYAPLAYLAALALSFASARLSAGLCLCVAVYFGFRGWPTRE